jgi:hypothetical protein
MPGLPLRTTERGADVEVPFPVIQVDELWIRISVADDDIQIGIAIEVHEKSA